MSSGVSANGGVCLQRLPRCPSRGRRHRSRRATWHGRDAATVSFRLCRTWDLRTRCRGRRRGGATSHGPVWHLPAPSL